MDWILTTSDLTKQYGKTFAADKVNLHIPRGKVYGLIGRNGAGKTTVLKMLCGLSVPTSGSFSFNGKTGRELGGEMRNIGCLIETPGLYLQMSAYDNLKMKCLAMGRRERAYIEELLELVGLTHAAKKHVRQFSLGMKQRLGIALALAGDPSFVVLDEPINGLDPQGIMEMRGIIAKLSHERGITVIVSSHILEELHKVADCFGIIHSGKLVDELSVEELNSRCAEYTVIKAESLEAVDGILRAKGITDFSAETDAIHVNQAIDDPAALLRALVEQGVAVTEFARAQGTLEDYYLKQTGGAARA